MDNLIGQSLDRYKIVTLLGEGGMGSVFKARDVTLQRDVALKVMHAQFGRQPNFQERFLQEARTAARMDHPGIVKVYDFGQARDMLYIVMELLPGANLAKMLKDLRAANKWILLPEALEIVRQVTDALDFVHKQGILHRDIKPDNIMLKPEPSNSLPFRPVLTDLGLAKLAEGGVMTQDGQSMGTPGYMSPEQALGEKTDARSDVYSLGILLYEMAVGQLPFPARTLSEAIRYHVKEQPPDPRKLNPAINDQVAQVILKAVEKNPANRFQDAASFAQAIAKAAQSISSTIAATSAPAAPTVAGNVSIMTQYAQSLVEQRGQSVFEEFPKSAEPVTQDRIQILDTDHTSRSILLKRTGFTIGRDDDNDLPIRSPKVSRHHARIEFDGANYRVSDLDSTNGTYLGTTRLLPGIPEIWTVDKALRIGDTYLRLERVGGGGMPDGTNANPATVAMARQPGTMMAGNQGSLAAGGSGRIGIYLDNTQLSVAPGSTTSATLTLLNQGTVVDHFKVIVTGIPAAWVSIPQGVTQLMPGAQREISVTIQPPQNPQSKAGRYPISLRVQSQDSPDQVAETKATLTVGAYSRFVASLRPQKIRRGQAAQLSIQNQGNSKEAFKVALEDNADELSFQPPQSTLSVTEGQAGSVEFQASTRTPRWLGGDKNFPFTVRISTPAGEAQNLSGEFVSKPIIPPWLLVVLPVLLMCIIGGAIFSYTQYIAMTSAKATQDAAYQSTVVAIANATLVTKTPTMTFTPSLTPTHTPTSTPTPTGTLVPTDTPTLTPTPTGTTAPTNTPTITLTPTPFGPWSGTWNTNCALLTCGDMILNQNGTFVQGSFANGNGVITGNATGNHISGNWQLGGTSGSIDFWQSDDGQTWQGNWNSTFDWCGTKTGSQPSPCGLANWFGSWTDCYGATCDAMTLIQNGKNVTGIYSDGATLSGSVNGTTMTGTWNHGGTGNFTFYLLNGGQQFNGNWNASNDWCGFRSGSTRPSPCYNTTFVVIATPIFILPLIPILIFPTATP